MGFRELENLAFCSELSIRQPTLAIPRYDGIMNALSQLLVRRQYRQLRHTIGEGIQSARRLHTKELPIQRIRIREIQGGSIEAQISKVGKLLPPQHLQLDVGSVTVREPIFKIVE